MYPVDQSPHLKQTRNTDRFVISLLLNHQSIPSCLNSIVMNHVLKVTIEKQSSICHARYQTDVIELRSFGIRNSN